MNKILRSSVLFLVSSALFAQAPFTRLVVFGDSLSDNGNLYAGTTLLGIPTPGPPQYATGEYTDGVNSVPSTASPLGLWIEQLAPYLNVPVPQPFAKGGLNYATASAQTGANPAFSPTTLSVPWATDQLNEFLKAHPVPPSTYLYAFWCGANDILAGVNPSVAVANVKGNIDTLATAGAKYFLWVNMPPMGEVPEEINTSQRAAFDAAAAAYNTAWTAAIAQLEAAHPGIAIAPYDVYSGFSAITGNPALYGLVNVTSPAQGSAGVNPNTYLFWDMLHPTTVGHSIIAGGAFTAIAAGFGGLPAITSVTNAYGTSTTIAPNTWVAIKGSGLSAPNDSRIWQSSDFVNGQMPQALDGVSVSMNGEKAYVYYISPTQLNILTPPDLASGPVLIQVMANGQMSEPFPVESQALSPSFFTFDGTNVVGTHLNGSIIGPTSLYPGASTPAQAGEEVVLYGNGFGVTSVPVTAGSSVQSGTLATMPVVTIGGLTANVIAASLISPGLYQFNVIVPGTSGLVPLSATYNGAATQSGVVIAIQ
jgi:uncharacterized protein (TIGR03437 family)